MFNDHIDELIAENKRDPLFKDDYPKSENCAENRHNLCDRDYCNCQCHGLKVE